MTLTNEQSIEIAEEVWGWKPETIAGRKVWRESSLGGYTADLHYIVNSWQGFGRTVEAMLTRDDLSPIQTFKLFDTFVRILLSWLRNEINLQSFWESTHLAALEAIRKEKKK